MTVKTALLRSRLCNGESGLRVQHIRTNSSGRGTRLFSRLPDTVLFKVPRGNPTRGMFEISGRSEVRHVGALRSDERKKWPYNGDSWRQTFSYCSWRPAISAGSWGSRFRELPTPSGRSGSTGVPAGPCLSLALASMNTKPRELSAPARRVAFALMFLAFLMACKWRICAPVWLPQFTSRKQHAVLAGWRSRHGCPAFFGIQSTTGFPQWMRIQGLVSIDIKHSPLCRRGNDRQCGGRRHRKLTRPSCRRE